MWAGLALVVSIGLCFVPLFNLVGYELGLVLAPFAAAVAVQLGLRRVGDLRQGASRSERERADVRPGRTLATAWLHTWLRSLVVLAIPLVVLSLNALRVRNCNVGIGLVWYAALPIPSAAFGAGLGVALAVALPLLSRRGPSVAMAFVVPLMAIGWSLARVYTAPPIFVFDPVVGYFAGSLYDENVGVPTALWWSRAYHAAIALTVLTSAARWLSGPELRLCRAAARGRAGLTLLALASLAASATMYRLAPRLGFRHDAATIARALGSERVTPHFVVHYSAEGPYAPEMDNVARELEFRYAELRAQLGRAPSRTVHAYLFSSAAEKQALMGAGRTYIAKPWRYELYVNHEPFPQTVLGHELAHVFGADVGDGLLGVARSGLRLDMGLIEGFAEALTWHGGSLTPDEAVRVLELLGQRPVLARVMSPQFWSLPAQQAYAVAGSFVHYLLVHDGAEKLTRLYRLGGTQTAYAQVYGRTFSQLEAEWSERVRAIDIPVSTLERERERILRPSIFHRPCAHDLARRMEEARALAGRGDHDDARKVYESVCADEPDDPAHIEAVLRETLRGHDAAEVARVAERLLSHRKTTATQRAAAFAVLGDHEVRRGYFRAAAEHYEKARALPTDEGVGRLYTVKRLLASRIADAVHADVYREVLDALVRITPDAAADYAAITGAANRAPDDALLSYLAARQYAGRDQLAEAERSLAPATTSAHGLPDERFEREAARMSAELAFRRKAYPLAASRYASLAEVGPAGSRLEADRWARRARWFAEHE